MVSLRPITVLGRLAVALVVAHILAIAADRLLGAPREYGVLRQLDLNAEANLTAWFGSFLILASAVVAALVALTLRSEQSLGRRWAVLAALLVLMAVDETAQLHDLATGPLRRALDLDSSIFHFAWVVPAIVVLPLLARYLRPLVGSLAPRERAQLLTALAVYLVGAVVLEMVGGAVVTASHQSLPYLTVVTVEEACELVGSLLLLRALLVIAGALRPEVLATIADGAVTLDARSEPAPRRRAGTDQVG